MHINLGHGLLQRYGFALLLTALAVGLSVAFRSLLNPSLFVFIFVAVTASAAYGGFGPAALASVLSVLSADLLLITGDFNDPSNYVRLAALLLGAGITSALNASLRTASDRANNAAAASQRAETNALALAKSLEEQVLENRKNETRLGLAVQAAGLVAWQWDPKADQITTGVNFREVYGIESLPDSSAGFALIHPEDRERHQACVLAALRDKRPYHSEFRITRPDNGKVSWLEERAAPVMDDAGEVIRLVGIVSDVTPRREAALEREQLLEAERHAHALAEARAAELEVVSHDLRSTNRDLDQFAYIASHDLKAPLRGIANLTQWIEEDLGDRITPQAMEQMRLLKGRVHRMEALIDGILRYSRAGRSRGNVERVDLRPLIEQSVELLDMPADASVAIPDELPAVLGVPVQLEQVFLNLIGNAVKHARGKPVHVDVLWRELEHHHEFAIRDNGPGIASEYHDRIWGLFQTLEARDTVEGAGIGLSVVRRTVESVGGTTWLESPPEGGSTFYFTWPKAPKAASAVTQPGGASWKTES